VIVVSLAGGAVVLALRQVPPDQDAADAPLTRDTEDTTVGV
jgi:hypothetical protein